MRRIICLFMFLIVLLSACGGQKEVKYSEWSDWKVWKYSDDDNINWTCTDTYQIQDLGTQNVQIGTKTIKKVCERYIYQEFSSIEYVLPEGRIYEIYATPEQISAHDYSSSLCEVRSDWEQTDETVIWHSGEEQLVPTIDVKWELDSHSIVNDKIEYVYRKYVRKVDFISDSIGSGSKTEVPIYGLIPKYYTISDDIAVYGDQKFYRDRTRTVIN